MDYIQGKDLIFGLSFLGKNIKIFFYHNFMILELKKCSKQEIKINQVNFT